MAGNLLEDLVGLVVLPAVDLLDDAGFAAFAVVELDLAQVYEGGFVPGLGQFFADLLQQGMGVFLAG